MNEHKQPGNEVDALVRAYLERQAASVDASHILEGIRLRLSCQSDGFGESVESPEQEILELKTQNSKLKTTNSKLKTWSWRLAAAAAVFLAIFGTLRFGPGQASARSLMLEAQKTHADSVDRCYRIEIEPAQAVLDRFPSLETKRDVLWTRGDRFWIEASLGDKKWTWGRDEKDRIWLVPSPTRGVRYDPDEIPENLALFCDVRALRMETLLDEVLRDFDLKREKSASSNTELVRAELKPGHEHPTLRSALIEVDGQSKVIHRLELWRTWHGQELAHVTFTLVDTRPQGDDSYQPEGHLDPGAPILTRDQPAVRFKVLFEHFGSIANKLFANKR